MINKQLTLPSSLASQNLTHIFVAISFSCFKMFEQDIFEEKSRPFVVLYEFMVVSRTIDSIQVQIPKQYCCKILHEEIYKRGVYEIQRIMDLFSVESDSKRIGKLFILEFLSTLNQF